MADMANRPVLALLLLVLCLTMDCAAAQAVQLPPPWQPEPPKYTYDTKKDISVRMDDGVVLQADEYFPVHPVTGAKNPGRFPVLLAQTPYGKSRAVQKPRRLLRASGIRLGHCRPQGIRGIAGAGGLVRYTHGARRSGACQLGGKARSSEWKGRLDWVFCPRSSAVLHC